MRHCPPLKSFALGRTARDAFYVRRASWQRAVRARGVAVAEQALAALATEAGRGRVPPL